jgi:hypothetical protein
MGYPLVCIMSHTPIYYNGKTSYEKLSYAFVVSLVMYVRISCVLQVQHVNVGLILKRETCLCCYVAYTTSRSASRGGVHIVDYTTTNFVPLLQAGHHSDNRPI